MTALAVQGPGHAGAQLTMTAIANGDTAPTGAGIGLLVTAPSSASATVTIPIPNVDGTQAVTGRGVTIATGSTPWLIPLPDSVYGAGPVTLAWTGTLTAATCAVVRIP